MAGSEVEGGGTDTALGVEVALRSIMERLEALDLKIDRVDARTTTFEAGRESSPKMDVTPAEGTTGPPLTADLKARMTAVRERAAESKSRKEGDDSLSVPPGPSPRGPEGPRARGATSPMESTGWLPVMLPGTGAEWEMGDNPYKYPPLGLEFDRPQQFTLSGDEAYVRMMAGKGMAIRHEYRTLTPLCFYMHNQLMHMERLLAEVDVAEFERWHSHFRYLHETLLIAAFRQDFLTLVATEGISKPELVAHVKNAMDDVSVRPKTGAVRELVDDFRDRTTTASANRAASSWAARASSSGDGGSGSATYTGRGRGRGRGQIQGASAKWGAPNDSGKGVGAPRQQE